tara:strand:+ start:120 stop:617 length:498 start_codon:yes stop_codon:yes gene_type:complete
MILKESDLRRLVREVVRNKEKALEEEVRIEFPDEIPAEMLSLGDSDPEISGFVYLKEKDRERLGIYYKGDLVGFATPREDPGGWRIGAIYVDEDVRRNVSGIGGIAIDKFFEGRKAANLYIGVDNIGSQKAFSKAGFKNLGKKYIDPKDGWIANLWGREESDSRR